MSVCIHILLHNFFICLHEIESVIRMERGQKKNAATCVLYMDYEIISWSVIYVYGSVPCTYRSFMINIAFVEIENDMQIKGSFNVIYGK